MNSKQLIQPRTLLAAVFLFALGVQASAAQPAAERGPNRLSDILSLSDRQSEAVRTAAAGADAGERSWAVARTLQAQLTSEQKATLFGRATQAGAYLKGVRDGNRGRSERRMGRRDRGYRSDAAPQRGFAGRDGAPMAEALGLNDSQRELLRIHRAVGVVSVGRAARMRARNR